MTQTTLLPFVLKRRATESPPIVVTSESAAQVTQTRHRIEGSACVGMYAVPKSAFTKEELARHQRNLTMIPKEFGFNSGNGSFQAFEEDDANLYVPRFYGFEQWGLPENDHRTHGVEMTATFEGSLKDYQTKAVDAVIDKLRTEQGGCLLVLPCGYGKTVCGLFISSRMRCRTLILVHKAFLVEQWTERARAFLPQASIGKIQQNVFECEADIVIGMIQSISKRQYSSDELSMFGLVIIDEAHHIAAPFFSKALRNLKARHIVGLSATPDRADNLTALLYWSMGKIGHQIERTPEHTLVSCVVYEGGSRREIKQRNGQVSLALMLNILVKDQTRNKIIAERIVACFGNNRYTIVLSDRIAQLRDIFALLKQRGIPECDVSFYIGTTSSTERVEATQRRIILSSYSMAKEGLDIPRLDCLVLATPKGDIVQASGRIQRKCAEKKTPLIIDVVDTFSVFEQLRWKRWNFYRREGFACQTYNTKDEGTADWFE